MSWRFERYLAVATAALLTASCQQYDAPPDAALVQPEGGAFVEGETVRIEFSEPVAEDSISLVLWPNERDIENEIVDGTEPVVERCALGTCGELTVKLSRSRRALTLDFAGELGKPGRPYVIELLPGLSDDDGNTTVAPYRWDMQFKSTSTENEDPVEFDDGVYIVLAQVERPIPTVFTLITHFKVLESGEFALAGAEGDEINGAPKNTRNPEDLVVDATAMGYTLYAKGFVSLTDDGKRLLETEPFFLSLPLGPLDLEMENVRMFAEIVKNPETGIDQLDGTLSFEKLKLVNGANITEQEGDATAMIADRVPDELVPQGTPQLCGDLCGAVIDGTCEPPEEFPPSEFCESAQ